MTFWTGTRWVRTWGRICWHYRWSGSWIGSGYKKGWTCASSTSGVFQLGKIKVCIKHQRSLGWNLINKFSVSFLRPSTTFESYFSFILYWPYWFKRLYGCACLGMVELVLSSETLRKIQVEYGVTGSFKDKPLAEWLRKYNPAEDEYEKVNSLIYTPSGVCTALPNMIFKEIFSCLQVAKQWNKFPGACISMQHLIRPRRLLLMV